MRGGVVLEIFLEKVGWKRISSLEALLSLPLPTCLTCLQIPITVQVSSASPLQEASPDTSGTLRPSLWKDPMDPGEKPQLYMCPFLHGHCILSAWILHLLLKEDQETKISCTSLVPWTGLFPCRNLQRAVKQPKSRDYCFIPVELTQA